MTLYAVEHNDGAVTPQLPMKAFLRLMLDFGYDQYEDRLLLTCDPTFQSAPLGPDLEDHRRRCAESLQSRLRTIFVYPASKPTDPVVQAGCCPRPHYFTTSALHLTTPFVPLALDEKFVWIFRTTGVCGFCTD